MDFKPKKKFVYYFFLFFFLSIFASFIYFIVILKNITITFKDIEIRGNKYLTRWDIIRLSRISLKGFFYSGKISDIENSLNSNPRILNAEVFKEGDTLIINLKEREPTALLLLEFEGKSKLIELSKDGLFIGYNSLLKEIDLPVISGDIYTKKKKIKDKTALSILKFLSRNQYAREIISEFHIKEKEDGSKDIYVYIMGESFPSIFKESFDNLSFRKLLATIDFIHLKNIHPQKIDFRLGDALIKPKKLFND